MGKARHIQAKRNCVVVLAFDGGGTRTRCLAITRSGCVLGAGVSGPSNVAQCAARDLKRSLQAAARMALAEAGLATDRVRAVGAGLAGVFPDGRNRETAVLFLRSLFRRARVQVVGDAVIALRGAIPEGHGVVALSGTGASVFGVSRDSGAWARAGGGGPILGDDGSGYRVALDGLRAAWRSLDGRDPPTSLAPRMACALGVSRFEEAPGLVYRKTMTRARLASLARVVVEAADGGDRAALDVLRRAGLDLGHAAAAAIRALRMRGRCIVSHHGALFTAAPAFADAFQDAVRAACPEACIRPPVLPPLGGAFLIGLEALGDRPTEDRLDAFQKSLLGCSAVLPGAWSKG